MKTGRLNKKQIIILAMAVFIFTAASVFVYLKRLRTEMTAEAGLLAGIVIDREQKYFNLYGEFAALEERSESRALELDLKTNKYFTLMRVETSGDSLMLYAECAEGFFRGTELFVLYDPRAGVTEYKITEKTKIPLPLL